MSTDAYDRAVSIASDYLGPAALGFYFLSRGATNLTKIELV